MKARMIGMAAAAAVVAAATVGAQAGPKQDTGIAGTWTLTVKGPAAHGDMQATMELRQDGRKVTGTFVAHGKEQAVKGTFEDNTLSLETTETSDHHAVTFTAKLKDDGSLAGYLSGPVGDMEWTGRRNAER